MSGGASPGGRLILSGRFETVRLLGRGASGQVVLARQLSLDRLVAVKLLYATADVAELQRLQREGRLLARLSDAHVVQVHELVIDGRDVALVMDYVEGGSLGAALSAGLTLDVPQRLTILRDVAGALEAAHAAGVVHRDVKPANVLLRRGRALLGDFGLARPYIESAAYRTLDGSVAGTPGYLAPEVLAGAPPSTAADTFAFAVLALQLLRGSEPATSGIPTDAPPALASALGSDPGGRPGPLAVVAELEGLPRSAWAPQVSPRVPAARDTRRSSASPIAPATGGTGTVLVTKKRSADDPPDAPKGRLSRRLHDPAVWVGAIVGLALAVLVLWRWG